MKIIIIEDEYNLADAIKRVLNKKEKGDKITLKIKYPNKNEYKEKEITITLK